jgi:hypothetical protein
MQFRHLRMKKGIRGVPVVYACVVSLWIVMCSASSVFAETAEVELYQDAKGEWKLKQLTASQPKTEAAANDLAAEVEGATDVELYQDASGEWKVRYVKAGKPVEIPELEAKKEAVEEPAESKEPVLVSQVMFNEESAKVPAEETPAKTQAENKVAVEKTAKEMSAPAVQKPAAAAAVQPVAKPKPAPVAEPVVIKKVEKPREIPKETYKEVAVAEIPLQVVPAAAEEVPGRIPSSPFDVAFGEVSSRDENNQWEIGADILAYKNKQDLFENNLGFMQGKTNEGNLYGVHVGYEHIFAQNPPNRSLKDIMTNFENVNRYKVTADYHFGTAEYSEKGDAADDISKKDFTQQTLEVRGVGGYDFMIANKTRVTPFLGLGYRFTHDPSGGILDAPPYGVTNAAGEDYSSVFYDPVTDTLDMFRAYSTQLHSFYLPIGLMTNSDVTDNLSLGLNLEFDYVFLGIQRSSFEDLGPLYDEDAGDRTKSIKNFSNKLKGGIGLKGSVRVTKKQHKFDWYVEPYVRYWNLRKNEKQYEFIGSDGTNTVVYTDSSHTRPYTHVEPDNTTTEYGLQVGVVY